MAVLDPGATPHPPHRHPEEEFLIIASGTGEIECAGVTSQVGPGAIMYCAGNTLHGITNTGHGADDVLLVQVAGGRGSERSPRRHSR